MEIKIIDKIKQYNLEKYLSVVNMTDRDKRIVEMYLNQNISYKTLGDMFGISGERVRQIIDKFYKKANHYYRKDNKQTKL